jgi:hypothetical protein
MDATCVLGMISDINTLISALVKFANFEILENHIFSCRLMTGFHGTEYKTPHKFVFLILCHTILNREAHIFTNNFLCNVQSPNP